MRELRKLANVPNATTREIGLCVYAYYMGTQESLSGRTKAVYLEVVKVIDQWFTTQEFRDFVAKVI